MNKDDKYILQLLKNSLCDTKETLDNIEISKELFIKVIEHQLEVIVYEDVWNLCKEKKIQSKWLDIIKKRVMHQSLHQIKQNQEIKSIIQAFKNKNTQVILFKGLAIARYYRNLENRLMEDVDLLLEQPAQEKADHIMLNLGYQIFEEEINHPVHNTYIKNKSITVELHKCLLNPSFPGKRNMREWYSHIWKYSKSIMVNNIAIQVMSIEDEIINQVSHFATHCFYQGAKIKHIYDVAILIKKNIEIIDWGYIENTLNVIKFIRLGKVMFSICDHYFNIKIPTCLIESDDILLDNLLENLLNNNSKQSTMSYNVSWNKISWRFPFLLKYKTLTPFVLVIDFLIQLIEQKRNPVLALKNSLYNIRQFNKKAEFIKKFELIF